MASTDDSGLKKRNVPVRKSSFSSKAPGEASGAKVRFEETGQSRGWKKMGILIGVGGLTALAAFLLVGKKDPPILTSRGRRAVIPQSEGQIQQKGLPGLQPGTPNYRCDPATCQLPNCYCPSTSPPGNLTLEQTPQFVLLTYDDAVNTITFPLSNATTVSTNPNGCRIAATYFVSTMYTDYHLVQILEADGNEIAIHTMTHPGNPDITEIEGCRKAIGAYSGVNASRIRGFRAPYLAFDMGSWQALTDLGLEYDCTNPTDPRYGPWPFTMDNGFPYMCETGTCDYDKRFPGLWQVPMFALVDPDTGNQYTVMDPPGTPEFLIGLFKFNFLLHWEKYKTPMGLWLHPAWFLNDPLNDRVQLLNDFFDWTRQVTGNRVWYVTVSQLVDWMKDPKSVDEMLTASVVDCPAQRAVAGVIGKEVCNGRDDNGNGRVDEGLTRRCELGAYSSQCCFACPSTNPIPANPVPSPLPIPEAPGGSADCPNDAVLPEGGCFQGTWGNCACRCLNEEDFSKNGYCKDDKGVCSIVKTFDPVRRVFLCRGQDPSAPSTRTQTESGTATSTSTPTPISNGCPNNAVPPPGGCVQGTWADCACQCLSENDRTKNGYCKDGTGVCTVVKTYDFVNRVFLCPGQSISATNEAVSTTTGDVVGSTSASGTLDTTSISTTTVDSSSSVASSTTTISGGTPSSSAADSVPGSTGQVSSTTVAAESSTTTTAQTTLAASSTTGTTISSGSTPSSSAAAFVPGSTEQVSSTTTATAQTTLASSALSTVLAQSSTNADIPSPTSATTQQSPSSSKTTVISHTPSHTVEEESGTLPTLEVPGSFNEGGPKSSNSPSLSGSKQTETPGNTSGGGRVKAHGLMIIIVGLGMVLGWIL